MSCVAYVWFKLLKNFLFDTSDDKITLVGTIFSYLRFLLNTLSWISVRLNWKSPPCTYIETGGGGDWNFRSRSAFVSTGKNILHLRYFLLVSLFHPARRVLTHLEDFVPRATIRIQRRETRKDRRICLYDPSDLVLRMPVNFSSLSFLCRSLGLLPCFAFRKLLEFNST